MSRIYHDRLLGDIRVPSPTELRYRKNLEAIRALGMDPLDIHCACCGLRLTDLAKLKVSADGAIGPECSKHYPELFPCRHREGKEVKAA